MEGWFLREFVVQLDFEGPSKVVAYEVCHPRAVVGEVEMRRDYNEHGAPCSEYAVLMTRDFGRPASPSWEKWLKWVVFVRRSNDLTPLPEVCGELIRHLQPRGDPYSYYVFASKAEPLRVSSISAETTSPAPGVARTTPSDADSAPGCPCVSAGTSVHGTGTVETCGDTEPRPWWEDEDALQSSAG